ncbi:MAG: hypothetical protein AAF851_06265 [Myxococcota bacterium]
MEWLNGPPDPHTVWLHLEVFWWARIAKLTQFVSGLFIVVEIVGKERIDSLSEALSKGLGFIVKSKLSDRAKAIHGWAEDRGEDLKDDSHLEDTLEYACFSLIFAFVSFIVIIIISDIEGVVYFLFCKFYLLSSLEPLLFCFALMLLLCSVHRYSH